MSGKRFRDITWVSIDASLPCGMDGCEHTTTRALVERDSMFEGLWQLLPICDSCRDDEQEPCDSARRCNMQEGRSKVASSMGR